MDEQEMREALIDYFGTATRTNPFAYADLIEAETASFECLLELYEKVFGA